MKPTQRAESPAPKQEQKRKHRSRPTPKWLKEPAPEGPESVARRRCMLVLAVLSGEQPVTDAIESTGVSRQLYYQLEERALKAMLRALMPSAEGREEVELSLAAQLDSALSKVKQLEMEKRRAERLLLLTRKLIRPGQLTVGRGGRPRKYVRRSATSGPSSSSSAPTKPSTPGSSASSTPAPTGEPQP